MAITRPPAERLPPEQQHWEDEEQAEYEQLLWTLTRGLDAGTVSETEVARRIDLLTEQHRQRLALQTRH